MCGIVGFVDFRKKLDKHNLQQMSTKIGHRGPDGSGAEIYTTGNATVGFGHRRLAILDLSSLGKQPMSKSKWHITYNGEIYNFEEVRDELIDNGYSFLSGTDTEVVLSAFDCWGNAAVHKFNGMFAFAIYSEDLDKVWLYRDRAGVKPLYVYQTDDVIVFASELKAFRDIDGIELELDPSAVQSYFTHGHVPTPNCIFSNCMKVEQGSYLEIDLRTKVTKSSNYWNVFDYVSDTECKMSYSEMEENIESLLISSCKYRLVADVPVGLFLSGGYDSSLVAALTRESSNQTLKSFTIGFESSKYDESPHAKNVAKYLGLDHTEYICTEREAKRIVPLLPIIFDEPMGDSSAIPTYLVSKIAKENVTVALSADGGDEQFVGYNRYIKAIKLAKLRLKLPKYLRVGLGSIIKNVSTTSINYKIGQSLTARSSVEIPQIQKALLLPRELEGLLITYKEKPAEHSESSLINNLFASEYVHYMQDDVMTKVDRAAMAVSLEGREPLLDYRIAEMTMGLPVEVKYQKNNLKHILKNITHKYIPKEIMDRPKQGFGVPINEWLRSDFKDMLEEYSSMEYLKNQGIFQFSFVEKKKVAFLNGEDSSSFMWHFLVFQLWYQEYIAL